MTTAGDVLARILGTLSAAEIPHMVVGSFASSTHGIPRSTHDLDIVIDPSAAQLDAWLAALDPARYYIDADVARDALHRRGMVNAIDLDSGWKVDLIVRKDRPFSIEEMKRRQIVPMFGVATPLATAEDTVLAKLEWASAGESERQLRDVEGILKVRGPALDHHYLERWANELGLADLLRTVKSRIWVE